MPRFLNDILRVSVSFQKCPRISGYDLPVLVLQCLILPRNLLTYVNTANIKEIMVVM